MTGGWQDVRLDRNGRQPGAIPHVSACPSGELGDSFKVLFDGMQLERQAGMTVLTGPVTDQAYLVGLIERIQELGVELVSVNPDQEMDG